MANIIQGTTPTFIFYTEEEIDLTQVNGVWVTFSKTDETELFTKMADASWSAYAGSITAIS